MTTPNALPASFSTHEDLCQASNDYLVIALFLRSRSDAFKPAIAVARSAELFVERDLDSMRVFVAGFASNFEGATQALDLIHYVRGWKGTHFYANGRMIIGEMEQAYHLESVIKCFAESCLARDYRAHCHRTIDSPYFPVTARLQLEYIHPLFRHITAQSEDGTFIFPCKYMLQWWQAQPDHPSSVRDQIQAEGVTKYCDACPRFNPDDFGLNPQKENSE
jgi:hypothetical protein